MILVDLYVPAVDVVYDFMLDENTEVEKIMLEVYEMLSKKMQSSGVDDMDEFMLYHMDSSRLLEKKDTLYSSGVRDGARLMLV